MITATRSQDSVESLIEQAQDLHRQLIPRQDAAALLASAAPNRPALAKAYNRWLQTMHHLPSDDEDAVAVLRSLEQALALVPRPPTFHVRSRRRQD